MDSLSPEHRSWNMSRIRGTNTKPELQLRSLLHRAGYRFRLHDKRLPGRPDIVLPKYGVVIFVNGCFWHRHRCDLFKWPKTREQFWRDKLNGNAERDRRNWKSLEKLGWRVFVFWECWIRKNQSSFPDSVRKSFEEWLVGEEGIGEVPR